MSKYLSLNKTGATHKGSVFYIENHGENQWYLLRKKCPYTELFWFEFSHIRADYGEIRITEYLSVFSPNAGIC